jgi:exodeoxyribonuclease V gamma subunit
MVLVPEIEKYAPYIEAVFNSRQHDDPQWFFATIADRRRSSSSAETAAFINILNLCSGRFKAPDLLDILENPAVADCFGIEEEKMPLLRKWICDANINWGIDREFREQTAGAAFYENSWRFGLARMQAGFAMGLNIDGDTKIFTGEYSGDILPCGGFSEQNAELLGRFTEFMELLFEIFYKVKKMHQDASGNQAFTVPWWRRFLLGIIQNFFSGKNCYAEAVQEMREAVDTVTGNMEKSGFLDQASLEMMIYALKSCMDSTSIHGGFLRGGITFCEAKPLRNIPARIICMLGMDENSFPRQTRSSSFDLMAARPRFGDRSARSDDRFLFLESLISARDVFYISYVGQGNKDNSEYPPSVLVSELLDYIASGYRFTQEVNSAGNREDVEKRLKIKHPLQAFSWRYFADEPDGSGVIPPVVPLISYSRENLYAAEKIFMPRIRKNFLENDLDAPPDDLLRINLADLVAFFRNPAKYFLTKRLGIRPSIEDIPEIAECEKLSLNNLDEYKIAEKIIRDNIAQWQDSGLDCLKERLKRHYRASGELSPGSWGEQQFESLFIKIAGFAETLVPHVREKVETPVADIHFENGVSLFVRLEDIYHGESIARMQILFRYAKLKESDLIRAAVCHLVANLPQIQNITGGPQATRLFGKDKNFFYAPVATEEATEKLQILLNIFISGLCKPLPFFPASSAAYYKSFTKESDREKALAEAVKKWEPNYTSKSESQDDYFNFFYKSEFPAGEEFEQTAMLLGGLLQLDIKPLKAESCEKEAKDA